MKVVYFTPLGWRKNIWNSASFPFDNLYVEFDNCNFEDKKMQTVQLLNSINEKYCIVTSSYGSLFLLTISHLINFENIEKIYFFDGLVPPVGEQLDWLLANRKDFFVNREDYLNEYLDLEDQKDDSLVALVDSLFELQVNKYMNFLPTERFIDYLKNCNINIEQCLNSLPCNIQIYSSLPLSVEYTEIKQSDHLVMLERKDIIADVIADIANIQIGS